MHPDAHRVQERLRAAGSAAEVVELPTSTHTSAEAAQALGVDVGRIAKSLVFRTGDGAVLVIASGAHRVDVGRLGAVLGATVQRADPAAVRAATGYDVGAVSPVALPDGLPVVVDTALAELGVVWAAGGTANAVFATTYDELLRLTRGVPGDVRAR